jgi:hypothetical protein
MVRRRTTGQRNVEDGGGGEGRGVVRGSNRLLRSLHSLVERSRGQRGTEASDRPLAECLDLERDEVGEVGVFMAGRAPADLPVR